MDCVADMAVREGVGGMREMVASGMTLFCGDNGWRVRGTLPRNSGALCPQELLGARADIAERMCCVCFRMLQAGTHHGLCSALVPSSDCFVENVSSSLYVVCPGN